MPVTIKNTLPVPTRKVAPSGGAAPQQAPQAVPTPSGNTLIYTYFTKAGETLLFLTMPVDSWRRIRLTLEDAGPVSIGTSPNLAPVLNGAGILLPTDVEKEFVMGPGEHLYVLATAVNRVAVIVEAIPPGGAL